MKLMNDKEFKKELVNILVEFDKICSDNNIDYSLIGGSLIGAIRHKGIIPWDDDIDVIMTKENYDKLLSIVDNYKDNDIRFINNNINSEYYYPFLKMINKKTCIDEKYKKIKDYGLYIDIFYYVNLPKEGLKRNFFWKKIQYYKFLISSHAMDMNNFNIKNKKCIAKLIGKMIFSFYGTKGLIKKYNKYINKYNKNNSDEVMGCWPCYKLKKEIQKKENTQEYMLTEFEKKQIKIFKNYDPILRTTFNDYMKLPKEEDRVNHGTVAYWIGQD